MSSTSDSWAFQPRAVAAVHALWTSGVASVLLVSPTGSGKSTMAGAIARDCVNGGGSVVFVAHRSEIVKDVRARFDEMGIRNGVTFGTVQSLVSRTHLPKATLLILDEAHHYVAAHWHKLRVREEHRDAKLLGMTATPQRADGTPLADVFERMHVAAQYSELIKLGCIVPAELWRPNYVLGANLAQSPVTAYRTFAVGQTVVFERSRAWVQATTSAFASEGVPVAGLTDRTPIGERREAIAGFRAGTIRVLVNHELLTEGVDLVSAETIIMARRYNHVSQYIQATGRGLRRDPNNPQKTLCRIVDLTGMSYRFNFPDADREYCLFGSGMSEERGPLPRTPAISGQLNIPLVLARRDNTPAARKVTQDTFWEVQVKMVEKGEISLRDARVNYWRRFGEARPASDAADVRTTRSVNDG